MKILVTGANGYIGSKIVKELCERGFDVIATDISSTYIDKKAKYIYSNIFEEKDNWFEYFERPDVCLHLAWRDGFVHNSSNHMGDLSNHYKFLINLIDNGLQNLSVMGTMHEIGYFEGAIDENTPCNPGSMYGIAKNALRNALLVYTKNSSCVFKWLRAFYIYGDDSNGNSIFCKIRKAVQKGETRFPFTSGKNKYDFIYINDLVDQIIACIIQNKINGVINVCSGIPVSLSEKVESYIKENDLPITLEYGAYPDRLYDSPCVYGDNKKILDIMEDIKCQNF